ncbi:MAG TPA: thioredoxin fold domain-containing protein, partial [Chitinophagaceae bacterium]|nr:thioredoxin fold domain-containing protein [Chitinophagaceae bacterium]
AAAKAQNKVIWVDFYTDWCAPCKFMAQTIFPLKDVGDFYNKNFICVEINAEKGEGIALKEKYAIAGYPTMIYTNANEEIVYRTTGSTSAGEFIDQGRLALKAPSGDLSDLKAKYQANQLSNEELYNYYLRLKAQQGLTKETNEVFDKYFASAANVSNEMFQIFLTSVSSSRSAAFAYLEKHREEFSKLVGREKVDDYIKKILVHDVQYDKYKSDNEYQAAKDNLKTKINLSDQELLKMDGSHYYEAKDEARYMIVSSKLAKKYLYPAEDHFSLSNMIGGSLRFKLNNENLLIVKSWAEHALAFKDNALNNASLAIVYKNLKDKEQALKYINKALEDCKRDNETYGSRIEMFKKEIESADY